MRPHEERGAAAAHALPPRAHAACTTDSRDMDDVQKHTTGAWLESRDWPMHEHGAEPLGACAPPSQLRTYMLTSAYNLEAGSGTGSCE